MAITLTSLSDLAAHGFDDVIDVRAPAEYADDHLPGAISLPVLDDDERARVGTIYKQVQYVEPFLIFRFLILNSRFITLSLRIKAKI